MRISHYSNNSTLWIVPHPALGWWQNSMEKTIHYNRFVQEHLLQNRGFQCLVLAMPPKALVSVLAATVLHGNNFEMRFLYHVLYIGTRDILLWCTRSVNEEGCLEEAQSPEHSAIKP
jgi:hypothetical protein